jgi:hypothetical protein|tara:strand:+ start:7209 stop:7457 length:249 start_codon:yes stop_codon:yes gene_type:complete
MSEENVIMIDNEKVSVNDLNQDQQYYYQQCIDLKNKQMKLKFDLDQINASYTVFENALTKSYEDTNKKNKEEQNTETKILEK